MTDEVRNIINMLSEYSPQILTRIKDNKLEVLEQFELIRVYASSGKVFAVTDDGEYILRLRLYELEKRLDKNRFVIDYFDLSLIGTIAEQPHMSQDDMWLKSNKY